MNSLMTSDNHTHAHSNAQIYGKAFAVGFALNVVYVIVEAVYGLIIDSSALLADAGHNLSDVLAWYLHGLPWR